ncbi:hypothetical protein [Cedecea sp.]|jgi:hypothetical protein|uniref:hypothetical protein n=1 Tax=Cedecea sp. TaxID=1970739 RepID=UPI0012AD3642|nr:hypothetical protein [Enterobacteriaceae bacterium RIT693]
MENLNEDENLHAAKWLFDDFYQAMHPHWIKAIERRGKSVLRYYPSLFFKILKLEPVIPSVISFYLRTLSEFSPEQRQHFIKLVDAILRNHDHDLDSSSKIWCRRIARTRTSLAITVWAEQDPAAFTLSVLSVIEPMSRSYLYLLFPPEIQRTTLSGCDHQTERDVYDNVFRAVVWKINPPREPAPVGI